MARELSIVVDVDALKAKAELRAVDGAISGVGQTAQRTNTSVGGLVDQFGKAVGPTQKLTAAQEDLAAGKKRTADAVGLLSKELLSYVSAGVIVAAIARTLAYTSSLEKMANALGTGIKGIQQLENIAAVSNTTVDGLSNAIFQMQVRVAGGDKSAVGALVKLHISVTDLLKLDPVDQFTSIARALGTIPNEADRNRIAFDLFGKTAREIMGALTTDVDKAKNSVHLMSDQDVKDLNRVKQAWEEVTLAAQRYGVRVLAGTLRTDSGQLGLAGMAAGGVAGWMSGYGLPNAPTTPGSPSFAGMIGAGPQAKDWWRGMSDQGLNADFGGGRSLDQQMAANKAALDWSKKYAEMSLGGAGMTPGSWEWQRALAQFGGVTSLEGRSVGTGMAGVGPGGTAMPWLGGTTFANLPGQGAGIAKIGSKTFQGPGFWEGTGLNAGSVSGAISGAVMGGGNIGGSIGATLAGGVAGSLGKMMGGTLGSIIPGLGTLLGSLAGGALGKLFGKSEESTKVSPLRDEFFKMAGGLDAINPKVLALTGNLDQVDKLFKAKTADQYNAALKDLKETLDAQDQAMQTLQQTAEKYGFTLAELGPTLQRQELDKQAQEIYKDFQVLTAGGLDHLAILDHMASSVNDYVHNALQMGVEVPNAMRPMLEDFVKSGQLLNLNGDAITNLEDSGISFAMTMSEGFTKLIDSVTKLTDAISRGLGLAISNIPDKTVTIHAKYDVPDQLPQEFSHTGSIIRPWGLERYHSGGLLADERLIIGQTGEAMLNRRAVANLGAANVHRLNRGGAVGGPSVVNHVTVYADGEYTSAMARRKLARVVLAELDQDVQYRRKMSTR